MTKERVELLVSVEVGKNIGPFLFNVSTVLKHAKAIFEMQGFEKIGLLEAKVLSNKKMILELNTEVDGDKIEDIISRLKKNNEFKLYDDEEDAIEDKPILVYTVLAYNRTYNSDIKFSRPGGIREPYITLKEKQKTKEIETENSEIEESFALDFIEDLKSLLKRTTEFALEKEEKKESGKSKCAKSKCDNCNKVKPKYFDHTVVIKVTPKCGESNKLISVESGIVYDLDVLFDLKGRTFNVIRFKDYDSKSLSVPELELITRAKGKFGTDNFEKIGMFTVNDVLVKNNMIIIKGVFKSKSDILEDYCKTLSPLSFTKYTPNNPYEKEVIDVAGFYIKDDCEEIKKLRNL